MVLKQGKLGIRFKVFYVAFLAATAAWVVFGEFGALHLYSTFWEWPGASTGEPEASLRVLVVSDPHIQCNFSKYESLVARWDSDRYVRRAFSLLIGRLDPDVVVVLGDVFAEGFKASLQDWAAYLQCLHNMLPVPKGVNLVVVPGDNDIGGEGGDIMNEEINRRYISEFGKMNSVVVVNDIIFVKVNTVSLIHSKPVSDTEMDERQALQKFIMEYPGGIHDNPPVATILLSHVPLNSIHGTSLKSQLLSSVSPDLVLSGHAHHLITTLHQYNSRDGDTKSVTEVTMPTCSYRMGEMYMGVGAVTVDTRGKTHYLLLWLPQRYPFLFSYVVLVVIATLAVPIQCVRIRGMC